MNGGDSRIPYNLNLRVVEHAGLHDFRSAERIAAVHQVHLGCEGRQEQCLLQCGVAAADHCDFLVLEEEAIAGCAPGDAVTGESVFALDVELTDLRTGGHDDGLRQVNGAVCGVDLLHVAGEFDLLHVLVADVCTETLSLLADVLHQLGALDALNESGEVLHLGGVHEGAAGRQGAGEEDRLQLGACRVDCRGVAGGAGAHNNDVVDGCVGLNLGSRCRIGSGCGCEVQVAQGGASEEASQILSHRICLSVVGLSFCPYNRALSSIIPFWGTLIQILRAL